MYQSLEGITIIAINWVIFAILIIFGIYPVNAEPCLLTDDGEGNVVFNCTGRLLTNVPEPPVVHSEVQHLLLGDNEISSLTVGDFDSFTSLTILVLQRNMLTILSVGIFDGLTKLRELAVSENSLTSLVLGVFDALASLKTLDLRMNALTSFPVGIFDSLDEVAFMFLSGNPLQRLQIEVFGNLNSLRQLWLPILCNCSDNQKVVLPFISEQRKQFIAIIADDKLIDISSEWMGRTQNCKSSCLDYPHCASIEMCKIKESQSTKPVKPTASKSTQPVSTESVSTQFKDAESKSIHLVPTESTSTDTPESQSTNFEPTASTSTQFVSTESESTQISDTESTSTHLVPTESTSKDSPESQSTQAIPTASYSTQVISTEPKSTQFEPTAPKSTQPVSTESKSTQLSDTESTSTHLVPTELTSMDTPGMDTPGLVYTIMACLIGAIAGAVTMITIFSRINMTAEIVSVNTQSVNEHHLESLGRDLLSSDFGMENERGKCKNIPPISYQEILLSVGKERAKIMQISKSGKRQSCPTNEK